MIENRSYSPLEQLEKLHPSPRADTGKAEPTSTFKLQREFRQAGLTVNIPVPELESSGSMIRATSAKVIKNRIVHRKKQGLLGKTTSESVTGSDTLQKSSDSRRTSVLLRNGSRGDLGRKSHVNSSQDQGKTPHESVKHSSRSGRSPRIKNRSPRT